MTTRHDLRVRQGETWSWTYTKTADGSPVDLSAYSARMAVKARIGGSAEAYLSTGADADGGSITLGGAQGTVTLAMTAAQTAALTEDTSLALLMDPTFWAERDVEFFYDLELVDGSGNVTRELEGRLIVHRQITD
jgi:hypothetical protein